MRLGWPLLLLLLLHTQLQYASALNATFIVPPNLPDAAPQPQLCLPNNATSPCNLRSAVAACTSYLIDSSSWCTISLSIGDRIYIDSAVGDIQVISARGTLEILGNGALISPLADTSSNKKRFMTLIQSNLNPFAFTISQTFFEGFSSTSGGGVFNFQNLISVNLTRSSFSNNTALSGGVVYVDGCAEVTISSCSFWGNVAQDGGAVQVNSNNHNILIHDSKFFYNSAKSAADSDRNQGGAIYFNLLNSDVEVDNCLFYSNEGINGGAVYFHTENKVILISNCHFGNNRASFGGGIMLYNQNLYVTVRDTILESNTALQFYGGGMFTYSSNFDTLLQNLTFIRNSAFYGGGLNADSDNTNLRVLSCHFWNNTAHYGGAFTLYSSHQITLLHDCTFLENKALDEAGAVYVVSINEDIEVYNCNFISNEAGTNGGAFAFVNGNTNITFFRSSFRSNSAGRSGGGIYSALSSINWKAISCIFHANKAGTSGGALSVANGNEYFSLTGCELIDNQANIGGAVYLGNTNDYFTITFSNISGNSALDYGGGVVSFCDNFAIYGSVLSGNLAQKSGGIHLDENSHSIFSHVLFINNIAISGQGGSCTILGTGDVFIGNSQFILNSATSGAAIFLSSSNVLIYNNTFEYNRASGSGGALYCDKIEQLGLFFNRYVGNKAVTSGGALYVSLVAELIVNSSSFTENQCTGPSARGSALFISTSFSKIFNNTFSKNSVSQGAGTIFWMHSTMTEPLQLPTNIFTENSALYGEETATEGYALSIDDIIYVTAYGSPISPFAVTLVDFYDEVVKTDSSSIVDMSLASASDPSCHNGAAYLTGGIIEDYRAGVALVSQLEAHCSPGQFLSAVASTYLTEIDLTISSSFVILFRECLPGEINIQGDCQICSEYYYSFYPTDSQCHPCPENAHCPGGNRIDVEKEYWRQCQTCHIVEPCRLVDVCLGGENVTSQCRIGHTGPLCNLCESGYALGADYKCAECTSNSSLIPLILGPILLLLFVVFLIFAYVKRELLLRIVEIVANSIQNTIERYRLDSFQTKVKIFISFAQILTSLPIMFDVEFPLIFKRFLDVITFSNLNFLNIFSVGCVWHSNFYDTLLLYTIGPVIVALIFCIVLHIRMLIASRINERMPAYTRQNRNDQMKLACIFIAFLVFSPTSIHIFQTFVCEEFEDGTVTLVADSSISCEDNNWKYYVTYAAIMCVIYPLGIPCFYMYSLYTYLADINPLDELVVVSSELHLLSSEVIQNEKIRYREKIPRIRGLSFLFASYLPKNWYFEIIECFRRLLLTSIPILFLRSKVLQIVLVLLISLGFCAVYMELRPFMNNSDNIVAIYSQWAISLTVLGSLCLRVDMTEETNAFGPNAIGILMTLVNILVAILTFVAAIRTDSESERERQSKLEVTPEPVPERNRVNSAAHNLKFSEVNWEKKATHRDSDDDSDDESEIPPSSGEGVRARTISKNPLISVDRNQKERAISRGVELRDLSK